MRFVGICLLIVIYIIILIPTMVEGYDEPAVSTVEDTTVNLSPSTNADGTTTYGDPAAAGSVYTSTGSSSGGAYLTYSATSGNSAIGTSADGSATDSATGSNWASALYIPTIESTTSTSMPVENAESIAARNTSATPEDVTAVGALDLTTTQYYTLKTLFVAFKQNIDTLKSATTIADANARAAGTTVSINDATVVQYKAANDFVLELFHDVEIYDATINNVLNDAAITSSEKITRIGMLLDSYDRYLNNKNVSSDYTRLIKLAV